MDIYIYMYMNMIIIKILVVLMLMLIVMITTMVNQPKWLRKSMKNDPKLPSRDHLGGDLGAMLASKIGLGGLC